jgi:hypothetical protein
MRSASLLIVVMFFVGCSQKLEPDALNLASGREPVPFHKDENAASERLAKWKAKWLNEEGRIVEPGKKGALLSRGELDQIVDSHKDTAAGKEAARILQGFDELISTR